MWVADMNEAETRAEQIDPALKAAGWEVMGGPGLATFCQKKRFALDGLKKSRLHRAFGGELTGEGAG